MSTLQLLLSALICAAGNRAWGSAQVSQWTFPGGSHIFGAILMTFAKVVMEPALWMWSPMILLLIIIFRGEEVDWWITPNFPYWKRLVRSLVLIPLPIAIWAMGGSVWHLAGAIAGPFLVALAYHLSSKQHKMDSVKLGECFAGAIVGIV